MGKVVGIVSLKGGVGKTSVVASLGSALSDFGKKVLLVDGNLSSPCLGLHFNIVEPEKTLHHVLKKTAHPHEAIYECDNFDLMPASIFQQPEVSSLKLKNVLSGLKKKYDVILLDSAPSVNEEGLGAILASDEVIAVTTPDHPTLSATIKILKLAQQRGAKVLGLIMNKVHGKGFEVSFEDVEETLEFPILALIPYDENVLKSLSKMESYVSHKPKSKGSIEYKKLASVLVGEKYRERSVLEFFRKITPSRQEINREIFYKSIFD